MILIKKAESHVGDANMSTDSITEEDARIMREAYDEEYRQNLWKGFKRAFIDRCKRDDNWDLTRFERWFYTAKSIFCVIFRLIQKEKHGKYPDHVEVSTIYCNQLYAGWEGCWLQVGHGIFSNWFFSVETDGDWNM